MIEFTITIKQLENGGISFCYQTPPGRATLEEQDTARELMNVLHDFICAHGATVIVEDSGGKNDPEQN